MTTLPPLPYAGMPAPPEPPPRLRPDGRPLPPGRKMGSKAKITRTLKEAILLAAEEVGDKISEVAAEKGETRPGGLLGYLTMVAGTDVKSFCALLGRVLPMEVTGAGGGAITVEIVRLSERIESPNGNNTAA